MDKVTIQFFNYGTWLDEANQPSFNVIPGEKKAVTRGLANYICAMNRGKIIHDPNDEKPIPTFPTINDLELHPVTIKRLNQHGIFSINELCALSHSEVLDIDGIGLAKLNEIQTKLQKIKLKLADPT